MIFKGLSPRLRGNVEKTPEWYKWAGSIPALAGERLRVAKYLAVKRVYPRACGGTEIIAAVALIRQGLSPRLRGNAAPDRRQTSPDGSIPALAGERWYQWAVYSAIGVYPRACGGTLNCGKLLSGSTGLSPRLRGNVSEAMSEATFAGSIPALAGERL